MNSEFVSFMTWSALLISGAFCTTMGPYEVQPMMQSKSPAENNVNFTSHTAYNTKGYLVTLGNSKQRFRVHYPGEPGKCQGYDKPSEVSKETPCIAAANGSPFSMGQNPTTGNTCLGTIVTNGTAVITTKGQIGFGVANDTSFIIGEVDPDVLSILGVQEFLSGFAWFVEEWLCLRLVQKLLQGQP
eukprot:m.70925 g.70925  ORF g.70925 m.70925 type:complete len:186 (+) comp12186_c0_seq2:177-734(+)